MRSLKFSDRDRLPELPGNYYIYAEKSFLLFFRRRKRLYIGTTSNLHERHTNNFGLGEHHKTKQFKKQGASLIRYQVIRNERERKHAEAVDIRRYKHSLPLNLRNEPLDKWLSVRDQAVGIVSFAIAAWLLWSALTS